MIAYTLPASPRSPCLPRLLPVGPRTSKALTPLRPVTPTVGRSIEQTDIPDDLVRQAMTGDRDAVTTLARTIQPTVIRYCRAKIRDRYAADDAAQEALYAVLRALPGYRFTGASFWAVVMRIAANKVYDHYRAHARTGARHVGEFDLAAIPEQPRWDRGDPELACLHQETNVELGGLLAQLTPEQREVVILRLVFGLSSEETGAAMTPPRSDGAVRGTLHRAVKRLRALQASTIARPACADLSETADVRA